MKRQTSTFVVLFALALTSLSAGAATLYWDIDGATPGAGGPTPGGAWTDALWGTSAAGDAATIAWTAGDSAIFSAGSDATGEFTVSGNATASSILIEEGTLTLSGTITLGAGSVTINSGATLSTASSARIPATTGATYTLNGGTLRTTNPGAAGSFVDVDATIILNGGGTLSHTTAGILNIVQTATVISGTGPLIKEGAGILAIASPSTYSGETIINNGTLRVRGASNRLPIGTDVIINTGAAFDPASLATISQEVASVSGAGNVAFSASGTMVVNQTAGTKTLSGVIGDTGTTFGKVEKKGAGEWILSGLNTFDGTFTQTAGTTTVTPGAALMGATGDLVVNGGTLNLNNSAQTVLSLAGTGGNINLASGHVFTVTPTANKTNASVIAGQGSFVKGGTGTLTLEGANTYSGGTIVNQGALIVNGSLGGGNVTVNSGGLLGGSGFIAGSGIIKDKIAPGNSIGTLSFGGIVLLADTSTTMMEIDPSQPQNADLLSAAGFGLGGTLVISQVGGALQGGQTFNLFDGALTGSFDSITGLPDVSANFWSWDTSGLSEGGNGVLVLVPEPTSIAFLLLGAAGLLLGRRASRR